MNSLVKVLKKLNWEVLMMMPLLFSNMPTMVITCLIKERVQVWDHCLKWMILPQLLLRFFCYRLDTR